VRDKFKGDRPRFLAAYRKQLKLLMWFGLVFAALGMALATLEEHSGEAIIKILGGGVWFAVGGISFLSLRSLANVPETEPLPNPEA
jgi:hypothetical protein